MDHHEQTVRETGRRCKDIETARADARKDHIAAIVAALRAGKRPTDVTAWSIFTGTYVRKLARQADVPPAPPGPKRAAQTQLSVARRGDDERLPAAAGTQVTLVPRWRTKWYRGKV